MNVKAPTVLRVLNQFERWGFKNIKCLKKKTGGRKRLLIGSEETEQKLLSNAVLQVMAPMSILRRLVYIKQTFNVSCG